MPIPVERLDEATLSLDDRILHFLKLHPSDAFNTFEIIKGVQGDDFRTQAVLLAVLTPEQQAQYLNPPLEALARLVERGRVKSAQVGIMKYWAYNPTTG